jgi:outer membrane protein TolC
LPVFNAGRVQAGIDMQDAASQRAELRYEQAIRQAAQDVESALAGLRQSQARALASEQVVLARQRAKAAGQRLFDEGQINGVDRVSLAQAHALAQLNQTESQESAWQAFIQLHRALGGGWQQATRSTANNTPSASTEHQP